MAGSDMRPRWEVFAYFKGDGHPLDGERTTIQPHWQFWTKTQAQRIASDFNASCSFIEYKVERSEPIGIGI